MSSGFFRCDGEVKEPRDSSRARHTKPPRTRIRGQLTGAAVICSYLFKCLLQISDQVVDILKSEGEPHKIVHHADVLAVFLRVIEE